MSWSATDDATTATDWSRLNASASRDSRRHDPGAAERHDPGLPDEHQYVLIALYTSTTLLAVTGNVVVIVVLSVGRRSRTDLRAFLVNLAVADLTMAIFCMPFTFTATMLHDWVFGAVMCTVVLFLQVSCQCPSLSAFWRYAAGLCSLFIYLLFIYLSVYYKIVREVHDRQTYGKNNEKSKSSTYVWF